MIYKLYISILLYNVIFMIKIYIFLSIMCSLMPCACMNTKKIPVIEVKYTLLKMSQFFGNPYQVLIIIKNKEKLLSLEYQRIYVICR